MAKAFSLTCTDCDGGGEFSKRRDAKAAGWINITEDDGPSWNYIGTCPDCQIEEVRTGATCLVRGVWWGNDPAEKQSQDLHPKSVKDYRDAAAVLRRVCQLGRELKAAEANREKQRKWNTAARTEVAKA